MADPERSTELLWGEGARRGLSAGLIVRTAVGLADAEGLSAVSMRRVARELGVTVMSLYRHVPGKAELVALMCDAVLAPEDDEVAGGGAEGGWRKSLETWARAGIALRRRHPWLAEAPEERRIPGPNAVALFERALAAVEPTGLPPARVVAVVTLVGGFVDSAARQEAERLRAEERSGVGHEEWWSARDSLYAHMDRYPVLTRLYENGAYDDPPDPFEFGLQRVLDGVEMLVRTEGRDQTSDESRCKVCGEPVPTAGTGRPRDYCSRACRQRAYRMRRK
ncbi:TetR/AcrR family transcriptional regulator [Nocardiopsis composta]|uniref:AcrR family transcriptional regulator n=1 Tax=Nocardiopsis composta TaxID=157465 RepID=A0A7W8QHQ3_9ACTN|nr:TetR/AcrR family transcriptional regulator [Nocardiopsis composta]MBB5429993.1 AcrR family transcriptional regulator [Nocardiopsis composta]